MPFREKRIKSGPILEIELYPISDREKKKSRAQKMKESKKEQKSLNYKNSIKHLIRLVNTNFKKGDLFVHPTYSDEHNPTDHDQAMKDMQNYIRRLKNWAKKNALEEIKYIAVIETGKKKRIHHHLFLSGVPREVAEEMWKKGRCNTDRLKPDELGFEAAARYVSKDGYGTKRRMQSKNLKMPVVEVSDSSYTGKKAKRMHLEGREAFEKTYPGYRACTDPIEVINREFGTVSYSIKMRRIE